MISKEWRRAFKTLKESTEEASTEMMTFAFSRMSDEVSSLIEARTKEIKEIAAKNEELLLMFCGLYCSEDDER